MQEELSKNKLATLSISVEESEKAKAIIFKLLWREKFDEAMKYLKAEKESPKSSEILQLPLILTKNYSFTPRQNRQKFIGIQRKRSQIVTMETS